VTARSRRPRPRPGPERHPARPSAVESVAAGLAHTAVLCWASTALSAAFHPELLADPYWDGVPWLRTDTLGIVAFAVAAVTLPVAEFLRLRRPAVVPTSDARDARDTRDTPDAPVLRSAVAALARSATWLSTALVGYLSLNAVTHPDTLAVQATHLAPWPTEALLRVLALAVCAVAATAARHTSAPRTRPSPTPQREGVQWAADRT